MKSGRRQAIFLLLLATACWGLSFPIYKAWLQSFQMQHGSISSMSFSGFSLVLRFGLGCLVFLIWKNKKLFPIKKLEWKQGIGVGIFGGLGTLFQMDGLNHTSASVSAFLTQTYVVVIPIFWALKSKKIPGRKLFAASLLVLAGIAVLSGLSWEEFSSGIGQGEAETLLGSLFFSAQILWIEREEFKGNRSEASTFAMFLVVFLLMWIPTGDPRAIWELRDFFLSSSSLAMAAILGVFATTLAYSLMLIYQPKVSSTEASFIYCTEPLTASCLALFIPSLMSTWLGIDYPNEVLSFSLVVGGALIFVANLLALEKPGSV